MAKKKPRKAVPARRAGPTATAPAVARAAEAPPPPSPVPLSDEISDGVRTIVLGHWRDFHALMIRSDMLGSGLIWRGQLRDWSLRPRLDRRFAPWIPDPGEEELASGIREAEDRKQWAIRYTGQLDRFRMAAAGRRGVNPRNLDGPKDQEDETDEWWALGQHYGLDTPLLDWTDSPFAALFFAFIEASTVALIASEPMGGHYRCVFALARPMVEFWNAAHLGVRRAGLRASPIPMPPHDPTNREAAARALERYDFLHRAALKFPKIRIVRPTTDENLRLLSQGGVFTQAPPGLDVEAFLRETFKGNSVSLDGGLRREPLQGPIMLKIKIREDDQQDCLRALNRMGINQRTLFPDLNGACDFVNRFIEDPSY